MNENELKVMSKREAKTFIKLKIENATFKYLQDKKNTHKKVKYIVYTKLEPQQYLKTSIINNKEAEILTALRSQNKKNNFHSLYENNQQCPPCRSALDTQEHCLICPKIVEKIGTLSNHVKYEHIFGNVLEQKEIAYTTKRRVIRIPSAYKWHILTLDPVQFSAFGK